MCGYMILNLLNDKKMKKRIRKTGEIVDVISYTAPYGTVRDDTKDFVDYIDSKGRERERVPMNIYWDFEDVEEELTKEIDWEERRYHIAKDVLSGLVTTNVSDYDRLAGKAVLYADALISKLKERIK